MTRERWEVTAVNPDNDEQADEFTYCDRERAMSKARRLRSVGWVPRIVRIRTYRVEVVYAWRRDALDGDSCGGVDWWVNEPLPGLDENGYWMDLTTCRSLFTDPLGKHSRRRAKAAALAAKPAGPCVLVAIRRRVKGGDRGLRLREAGGGTGAVREEQRLLVDVHRWAVPC